MDTNEIVSQLQQQRDALDRAITILSKGTSRPGPRRGVRRMSAEARRKISLAQKKRWAKQKRAA
jgi:type II secretory pathway component PulJ